MKTTVNEIDQTATAPPPRKSFETHRVFNQPPPLLNYNVFSEDAALREATEREGAPWALDQLERFGGVVGDEEIVAAGREANESLPRLETHDSAGNRLDRVFFHPAWHRMMALSIEHGIHSSPWTNPGPGAHVARAAMFMLVSQAEAGHGCPISMTHAAVPALAAQPDLAEEWTPKLMSRAYDPRHVAPADKHGLTCGMAMTEKQGGSDVRATTTVAESIAATGPGEEYLLTGHKWFVSAPMSDLFLTLAYVDEGLTCFLMPRILPDGTGNGFRIQRLKDKLGNRSNATGEVELAASLAYMVGEPGRGVPTIIEMVNHTRLDCALGSAACMRNAFVQAVHYVSHRDAFGKTLVDQPLMSQVLADLAIESEAATISVMRLARSYDAPDSASEVAFKRLATAVLKYQLCKRTPAVVTEALECLGGPGYLEDMPMARLYREAPLMSIWEGSGNVICLDVLRVLGSNPESAEAFFSEVDAARGVDARFDRFADAVRDDLRDSTDLLRRARRTVENMALALQGSLLLRHGDPAVAQAFVATRLDGDWGRILGTLPVGVDAASITRRHWSHDRHS